MIIKEVNCLWTGYSIQLHNTFLACLLWDTVPDCLQRTFLLTLFSYFWNVIFSMNLLRVDWFLWPKEQYSLSSYNHFKWWEKWIATILCKHFKQTVLCPARKQKRKRNKRCQKVIYWETVFTNQLISIFWSIFCTLRESRK